LINVKNATVPAPKVSTSPCVTHWRLRDCRRRGHTTGRALRQPSAISGHLRRDPGLSAGRSGGEAAATRGEEAREGKGNDAALPDHTRSPVAVNHPTTLLLQMDKFCLKSNDNKALVSLEGGARRGAS